jgi:DNA-binding response OmpR family regulator
MHILIAEDDSTSRLVLSGVLRKRGYEITETVNGSEAWLAMQKEEAPSLAIIDWMMPEINGLELIRLIREQNTNRPPYIIMLTTRGEKEDIISGLEAGANDYLAKPFDPNELCARIEVGRRVLELQDLLATKVEALNLALEQIKTLRGIVPICSHCKKIRDDSGYWNQVEVYIRNHTEAEFSHGICPDCAVKFYLELAAKLACFKEE